MEALRIKLKKGFSSDLAWEKLIEDGLSVLFSTEEDDSCELVIEHSLFLKEYDFIDTVEKVFLEDTNWDEQWKQHAPGFYDGKMNLDLKPFGIDKRLVLKPGPGFGDMSHPTTSLVLSMMPSQIQNRIVLDIGSGSGILTIAAVLFGAKEAIGIEIDPFAIVHAQENAKLNHVQERTSFVLPTQNILFDEEQSYLIVMNMIIKEQQMAWKMAQFPKTLHGTAIISGVLENEREHYLAITREWGWTLKESSRQGGWLGLRFSF